MSLYVAAAYTVTAVALGLYWLRLRARLAGAERVRRLLDRDGS